MDAPAANTQGDGTRGAPRAAQTFAARLWRHPAARPFLLLVLVSALTHFATLATPRSAAFDEVHFGAYASAYCCSHERFFDIHPPLAKLIIAGTAYSAGYRGGAPVARIGEPWGELSPIPLRLAPAFAGALLPLLLFALVRQLGGSIAAAALAGFALVFDNAVTAHTRLIDLDGIMLAAMFGALSTWLLAARATRMGAKLAFALATGVLLGLAAGSKWIGLAMGAVIGVAMLVDLLRAPAWRRFGVLLAQGVLILAAALAVYLLGWALHFALLKVPGAGDEWFVPSGRFLADVIDIHRIMFDANSHLSGGHPNASPWWSWPLMLRPIFYWLDASGAKIYLFGNPLVWWGTSAMLVMMAGFAALSRVTTLTFAAPAETPQRPIWLPVAGYVIAYLPFVGITRLMFMYHYFSALLFAILAAVLWLDRAGFTRDGGFGAQRRSYFALIALLAIVFVLLAPFTYGFQTGAAFDEHLFRIFPR